MRETRADIPTKPVAYLFFGFSRRGFEGSLGVCGIKGWPMRCSHSRIGATLDGDDTEVAGYCETENKKRKKR
jgi:hypothetical protein